MKASLILGVVALLAAAASPAMGREAGSPPVIKLKDARFGNILARTDHKALYFWNVEKRDFKIQAGSSSASRLPARRTGTQRESSD